MNGGDSGVIINVVFRDQAARDLLARLKGRMSNMRPFFASAGEAITEGIMTAFDTSTDPETGNRWKKVERKGKRHKPPFKPLILNSILMRSIHPTRIAADSVTVGTNVVYAALHQYGRPPIAARPYMGISAATWREIIDTAEDYLAAAERG